MRSILSIYLAIACCLATLQTSRSQGESASPAALDGQRLLQATDSAAVPGTVPAELHWYDFAVHTPGNIAAFATGTVSKESLPDLLELGGLTAGLMVFDHATQTATNSLYSRQQTARSMSDACVFTGDGRMQLAIAGGFGTYGVLFSDRRSLRVAGQMLEAGLSTGIVIQVLKRIAGRESPAVATSPIGRWRPFPRLTTYQHHQPKYYAFPSGHIATTVAMLTVLLENYPEVRWLPPVGYTAVGLVGISLVGKGWHWYSDLPLGIAIGHAFGEIVARHETRQIEERQQKFSVAPTFYERGNGIQVSYHI